MATYLDFDKDNNASQGFTHKFQTSTLEADHPPFGDKSNKVATTGWVSNLLEGNPMYPQVVQAGNLSINITEGYIEDLQGNPTLIASTLIPISVVGASTDYVYIRYSDMKPVISTILPPTSIGFVLANVVSDHTQILSINQVTPGPTGLASNDSPHFTGDPQAPHPPQGDYDNSIATTQWVKDELASVLGSDMVNRPTITLSQPSTLLWSSGSVNISGIKYDVASGTKVFTIRDNGTYTVRAVLQPGNTAIVEVSNTLPTNPYVDLATVDITAGSLGTLEVINPSTPPGDLSNTTVTTQYLFDSLMRMFHGPNVPKVSINTDKTQVLWTGGQLSINSTMVNITQGSITTTLPNGNYYLHARALSNTLHLTATLPTSNYKVFSTLEIFSNQIRGIYPIMPGFGI